MNKNTWTAEVLFVVMGTLAYFAFLHYMVVGSNKFKSTRYNQDFARDFNVARNIFY